MEDFQHKNCAETLVYFSKHPSSDITDRYSDDTKILLFWLWKHKTHPYPSLEEKIELMIESGLSIKKIEFWFGNARRRLLMFKGKSLRRQKKT